MIKNSSHMSIKKLAETGIMSDHFEVTSDDADIRRFFQEIEHTIKGINHEKISEIVGDVSRESFINAASTVARLRAKYLAKVIELQSSDDISGKDISVLRGMRTMYEEATEGFTALQHALNRGYFKLVDTEQDESKIND